MIIAIDIGNTNIVVGGIEQDKLRFTLRLSSDRDKTVDEYSFLLRGLLEGKGVMPGDVSGGIISSVVPSLKNTMYLAMEDLTGKHFLKVGSGIKTGLNIRIDNPAQLGADLVVNAVAALSKYKPPLVIFDMGTATTMSVLDQDGCYIGGMIIPGLRVSIDALSTRAAQLPYIHLGKPERLIGTNTMACMQSGAIYSSAAILDGLTERVEEELGMPVTAIATGGLMGVVHPFCKKEIHYDEHLLLEGLKVLYEKNSKK